MPGDRGGKEVPRATLSSQLQTEFRCQCIILTLHRQHPAPEIKLFSQGASSLHPSKGREWHCYLSSGQRRERREMQDKRNEKKRDEKRQGAHLVKKGIFSFNKSGTCMCPSQPPTILLQLTLQLSRLENQRLVRRVHTI